MRAYYASLLFSVPPICALPAHQPERRVVDPPGPPGASGNLRGSEALIGYDPSNNVPKEPSTVIPPDDFEIAPGQSEDPELGLFIDLEDVKNPQPIQGGTTKPTDPGPRLVSFILKSLFIVRSQ
jgi:hypothetical protein